MRETQLPTAVLIDVLSIQKYIFQSNKLKENLGASYIIEHVLYGVEFLGLDKTTPWWDGKMPINTTGTIGFVGGGNALLFFNDETQANAFLKIFFTKVYLSLPGLPIIYGIKNDFCIGTNYKTHFSILIKSLIICRNSYRFNMPLAKSPFHDNCVFTGNIAVDTQQGDKISASAKARLTYVDSAKNKHLELIEGDNKNNYTFTDELSKLAQPDEKSYIAVVHIDGNGIGDEFLSCESLKDSQTLSQAVNDLCKSTFKTLITEMINELDTYNLNLQKDGDKTILPIRPIIIGGDDITFVCEGTLGVYLAEKFIEIFSAVKIKEKYYNACAGIAIAKTKYPFSKIYYLADALCQEAKEKAKIKAEEKVQTGYPSAISYHIATNGISGSLADIRTQYYTNYKNEKLYKGPYLLEVEYRNLINGMKHFTDTAKIAKNQTQKIKQTLLNGDEIDKDLLGLRLRQLEQKTLDIKGDYPDIKDEYFDMIELLDFYPTKYLALSEETTQIIENA